MADRQAADIAYLGIGDHGGELHAGRSNGVVVGPTVVRDRLRA